MANGLLLCLLLALMSSPVVAQRAKSSEKKKTSQATGRTKKSRQPAAKTSTKSSARQAAASSSRTSRTARNKRSAAVEKTSSTRSRSRSEDRRRESEEERPVSSNRRNRRVAATTPELAKSKAQLEREKRENERKAQEANRILAQTRQRKEASLGQLNALQEKITVQQSVIGTIASEVRYLDRDVSHTQEHVGSLRLDLAALKQEYGRMIYAASKSTNATDKLMFLFAAESFNQFAMRLRYLRQYSDVRRRQAAQIANTQQTLEQQLNSLTRKRATKQQLLGAEVAEKTNLVSLKTEQNEVVQQLSQQEEQLKREVAERQQAITRLDGLIAEKVRAEIARAARAARLAAARKAAERRAVERRTNEATGETRPPTAAEEAAETAAVEAAESEATEASGSRAARMALTPEATRLSASFAGNRGRLPWPVSRGFVAEHFGRHRHAVLKNVTVENHGIDIQTANGEQARAIFDGRVLTVAQVPGMNTIVMIQHGEYFTVYAKLHNVRVSSGQTVRLHDPIGTVFTGPDGTTELQFQLWRNSTDLNPEAWLGRR